MKTITLKINERSKIGKAILELIHFATQEKKGVEIIHEPNAETKKAIEAVERGEVETVSLSEFRKELY